jgi:iron-sulfur cluster repair protein YtfE (RIC family)
MGREVTFPSEIRRTLLDEHARLRRLLDELEDLAQREAQGEELGRRVPALAGQLARAVEAHNAAEEQVLEPLLRTVDAWGTQRIEDMLVEHVKEHAEIVAALDAAGRAATHPEFARAFPRLAESLRAHMDREERTFLARDLLRDDLVNVDSTS